MSAPLGWQRHEPADTLARWRATWDLRPYLPAAATFDAQPARVAAGVRPVVVGRVSCTVSGRRAWADERGVFLDVLRSHPGYARGAADEGTPSDSDLFWAVEGLEAATDPEEFALLLDALSEWGDEQRVIVRVDT